MGPLLAAVLAATLASQAAPAPSVDLRNRPSPDAPVRVEVGVYLLDLSAVHGAEQEFAADVVVQARWHDPRLVGASEQMTRRSLDEVWHPNMVIVNQRAVTNVLPDVLRVLPDGTVSHTQRLLGTFAAPMDLRSFPLDEQRFTLRVAAASGEGVGGVELVAPSGEVLQGRGELLSVSDWHIGEARLEAGDVELGNGGFVLPGVALVVEGRRHLRYYVVQVILPVMMIVTMAWTVFWVDPSVVPTRIGTVVTTMLTLIAYRFALASLVPRLPYLTRLDWFMLGSTTLILATLMTMAASAYFKSRGRDDVVARIDRWGRAGFVAIAITVWTLPWVF